MLESGKDVPLVPTRGPLEPGPVDEKAPVSESHGKRDCLSREAVRATIVGWELRGENVLVSSHVSATPTVPVVDKVVDELLMLHFGL